MITDYDYLPQLQGSRGGSDDVRCFLQSLGGLLLALGFDHLGLGLSGGLGLSRHGPLELGWQPHVLNLYFLHPDVLVLCYDNDQSLSIKSHDKTANTPSPDAPVICGLVKMSQHGP